METHVVQMQWGFNIMLVGLSSSHELEQHGAASMSSSSVQQARDSMETEGSVRAKLGGTLGLQMAPGPGFGH